MPKTSQRPLRVFLCHAHSDKDAVKALYDRLTKDGIDVWLDKQKLLPGQDWELEIRKAVRESDVVVVCLSFQFNQAGFRQKEVRIALDEADKQPEGEIFIIPARLEECDPPESLSKWHWVNLFEPDGYDYLMRAFRKRAERIGAVLQPTPKGGLFGTKTQPKQKPPEIKEFEQTPPKPKVEEVVEEKYDTSADDVDEKTQRVIERELKRIQKMEITAKRRYKRDMFFLNIRHYFLPVLFALIAIALATYLVFNLPWSSPMQISTTKQTHLASTFTPSLSTNTPMIGLTALPQITQTPFSTVTPLPTYIFCDAKVTQDTILYSVPSIGYKSHEIVLSGSSITVIAGVDGKDWNKVSLNGTEGWLRSYLFEFSNPDCRPNIYPLSYLLGFDYTSRVSHLNLWIQML
jgi:hypothetical protein